MRALGEILLYIRIGAFLVRNSYLVVAAVAVEFILEKNVPRPSLQGDTSSTTRSGLLPCPLNGPNWNGPLEARTAH